MKTFNHRMAFLCLPLAASALMSSCTGNGYYADDPYNSGASVYVEDLYPPIYYDENSYYYRGRYYSGGRYETGRYSYNGRAYDNRYYHDGRYYYGGTRQNRPTPTPYQPANRQGYPSRHVATTPVQSPQRTRSETPSEQATRPSRRTESRESREQRSDSSQGAPQRSERRSTRESSQGSDIRENRSRRTSGEVEDQPVRGN